MLRFICPKLGDLNQIDGILFIGNMMIHHGMEWGTVRFRSCEQWITAMVAISYTGHCFFVTNSSFGMYPCSSISINIYIYISPVHPHYIMVNRLIYMFDNLIIRVGNSPRFVDG